VFLACFIDRARGRGGGGGYYVRFGRRNYPHQCGLSESVLEQAVLDKAKHQDINLSINYPYKCWIKITGERDLGIGSVAMVLFSLFSSPCGMDGIELPDRVTDSRKGNHSYLHTCR